jgi:hypothetical protein
MKTLQVVQWAVAGALLCGGVFAARSASASACYQTLECGSYGPYAWGTYQPYLNDDSWLETATDTNGTRQIAINLGKNPGQPGPATPSVTWTGADSCAEAWGLNANNKVVCYIYDNTADGNSVEDLTGECNGATQFMANFYQGQPLYCGNGDPPCPNGHATCGTSICEPPYADCH